MKPHYDDIDKKNPMVHLVIENVAISAWEDDEKFGVQIQLRNDGPMDAGAVQITQIRVEQGQFSSPPRLPFFLGDLGAGEDNQFGAVFRGQADGTPRLLKVQGYYKQGFRTFKFIADREISPNRIASQPTVSKPGQAVVQKPNTATYPSRPPVINDGNNAETPILIPPGPVRRLFFCKARVWAAAVAALLRADQRLKSPAIPPL